ncbi:lysophospholipid acyltransferase family protein [Flavivirga eckloniae]|uniref:1-acyl-sn-glycerol-3-phosphate acyltransferase n=1 Tax=Flavivirga eckloniae TaxID=1803846 RepID=A0A2K9PQH1_9FLAO|nr:lysophospholipid acyltransferase family protein [Flavivirga eckloniae]AUP79286.1 1-acyl-sn-glycerol-3-phosphate acyltransferase [Flavivirga eckloniae]
MQKLLSYPLSFIYSLCFLITLLIFHPLQWIGFKLFGYKGHKKVVDLMNICLMRLLHILGTRFTFTNVHDIEPNQPLIVVCNHQSMYDISPLSVFLRKYHPKFISKIELGKGIPSVSYNLRHGGSILIDRKNPRQALPTIMKFGEYIEKNKRAAVIFPEGTRSKDGTPKPFQTKGLEILFKKIPSAMVLPISINNSWKTVRYGKFPFGLGTHITFTAHKPIKVSTFADKQELIKNIEATIKKHIHP